MNLPAQQLQLQLPRLVRNNPPKYYAIPPRVFDNVVFGIEKFSDMLDEIRPLHEAHYAETETAYLDEPIEPNYQSYMELEKDGRYVCLTCRIGLKLVGYLQYYVFRDMHSRHVLQAREDAFFLHALVRGRKIAPQMLDYAEDALRALGCRYAGMTNKSPIGAPNIGPFLEERGYRPVAVYHVKKL